MSFELLPGLAPWLYGFIAVSALLAAIALVGLSVAVVGNRRIRLSRHEGLGAYYGRMVLSH